MIFVININNNDDGDHDHDDYDNKRAPLAKLGHVAHKLPWVSQKERKKKQTIKAKIKTKRQSKKLFSNNNNKKRT